MNDTYGKMASNADFFGACVRCITVAPANYEALGRMLLLLLTGSAVVQISFIEREVVAYLHLSFI